MTRARLRGLVLGACLLLLPPAACHRTTTTTTATTKKDAAPIDPKRDSGASMTASAEPTPVSGDDALLAIGRAEDGRRASDVAEGWRVSSDVKVRRASIRALARISDAIADPQMDATLLRALGDEDLEVVGWGAYGLGWACKGREDEHVKALAARAATLADGDPTPDGPGDAGPAPPAPPAPSRRDTIDARAAVTRAIGRCGGPLAEGVLSAFLRAASRDADVEHVAYALGAVASRRTLTDEAMGALLDRAVLDPSSSGSAAALFPIGRLDHVPDAWSARVLAASKAVLAGTSPLRIFAVRALEKSGPDALEGLSHIASRSDVSPAEREEAARSLGRLGLPGRSAAGAALTRILQDKSSLEPASLLGDRFNVLLAVVEALGQDAPKNADPALYSLASLPVASKDAPSPSLSRRSVALRCAAASALARAAYDSELISKCDPDPDGASGQRARLSALIRRPLAGDRRKVFRALATSKHLAVREAAIEAVPQHPELEESGRALLAQALEATEPGVVATAAEAIVQHPEHVLTLAKSERRAALDPRAPPPTSHPAMDLPAEIATALKLALGHAWREDAIETRTLLLDAAVAVSLPEARASATRACTDPNATMREHAARALRALGTPQAACATPAVAKDASAAPSSAAPVATLAHPVRVTFDIDGAKLAVVFEPELSPRAASRFVALARAGFYKGVVVHRVVPGYVVQFGDPGADGYGGSGELLRCETSPVPFAPLDVGVALAGRDTGSSQIFVTLARSPKLDGEYARVGHAEGDWDAVAQGDVIDGVVVEE